MSLFESVKLSDLNASYADQHQHPIENRLHLEFKCSDWGKYHKHAVDESFLIVSGGAEVGIVCEKEIKRIGLREYGHEDCVGLRPPGADNSSDAPFFMRIGAGMVHCVDMHGFAQVVKAGPYIHDRTIFQDERAGERPVGGLPISHGYQPIRLVRTGEESFHCADGLFVVGKREMDILKAEVNNTARKRIRLCAHKNNAQPMHEMFVVYTNNTYIQPNKHVAKDETFHILEGEADFIFYSESGDVLEIVPLGDHKSGKAFYVRVPMGVYHAVVMHSDYMVIHESTPGPYERAHTVWAPWAKSQGSRS